jgi:hypothetical protein
MQLKGLKEYLEVVADDGIYETSYGTATSASTSNSTLRVDPIVQYATCLN